MYNVIILWHCKPISTLHRLLSHSAFQHRLYCIVAHCCMSVSYFIELMVFNLARSTNKKLPNQGFLTCHYGAPGIPLMPEGNYSDKLK